MKKDKVKDVAVRALNTWNGIVKPLLTGGAKNEQDK